MCWQLRGTNSLGDHSLECRCCLLGMSTLYNSCISFARWWHHYPSRWFINRNTRNNFETGVCELASICHQRHTFRSHVLATVSHKQVPSALFGVRLCYFLVTILYIHHDIIFARWWHYLPERWVINRNIGNNLDSVVCEMLFNLRSWS